MLCGRVLCCVAVQTCSCWDVGVVEAKAVMAELQLAHEMGFTHILLENDSLVVIQALRRKATCASEFHLIIQDILALSSSFVSIVWLLLRNLATKSPII